MRFIEKNKKKIDPRYFLNEGLERQIDFNNPQQKQYYDEVVKLVGGKLTPEEEGKVARFFEFGAAANRAAKSINTARNPVAVSPEQQAAKAAAKKGLEKTSIMGAFSNQPEKEAARAASRKKLEKTSIMGAFKDQGKTTFADQGSSEDEMLKKAFGPSTPAQPQQQKAAPQPAPAQQRKLKESVEREVSYNKIKNKKNTDLFFALVNYVSTKD